MLPRAPKSVAKHNTCRFCPSRSERTTLAGMDQPSPPRPSFWRFSLRELLLVMLVIALVLGWGRSVYQAYKPFRPTAFAQNFDVQQDIDAIRRELGETSRAFASGGSSSSGRPQGYEWRIDRNVKIPAHKRQAFMSALQQRVKERLGRECWIGGGGTGRGSIGHHFHFNYSSDIVTGRFHAYLVETNDDESQLLIFIYEHRNWGPVKEAK